PAGAYNKALRIGWRANSKSTHFTYKNASTSTIDGIFAISLSTSPHTPGTWKFSVKGKKSTYAVTPTQLPLQVTVVLDTPYAQTGQCAETQFVATSCVFNRPMSVLKCK